MGAFRSSGEIKRKCKFCSNQFTVHRHWQVFCSDICKNRYNRQAKDTCFFCGVNGYHKHHIEPCSRRGTRFLKSVEWVYCCSECNSKIADRYFANLSDCFDHLIDEYVKKYKLNIAVVEWDEEEIQELGPRLRQSIKKHLAERHRAEQRVYWLKNMKLSYESSYSDMEDL